LFKTEKRQFDNFDKIPFFTFLHEIFIKNNLQKYNLVVRMRWMGFIHKWIVIIIILSLFGTICQACESDEHEEECYEETECEEVEEDQEETDLFESEWFIILEKLIDRYPILERIIERILQWIFEKLLGMEL